MKIALPKGFTFIELMIVLAVMGILAVIATPNLRSYLAQRRMNGAARQLTMDLMRARSDAVTTNKKIIVSLSSSHHQYSFVTDNDGSETINTGDTTGVTRDIYPDYYDVTFDSDGFNPIFRPDGTGQTGSIDLGSSFSGIADGTIYISRAGRVRIGS